MSTTEYEITVPEPDGGAIKPWRKCLTGLDESEAYGKACLGNWLDPAATYRFHLGTLIVGVDRVGDDQHRVRLWRVNAKGELTVMRDSTFTQHRSAFGEGMRKTLRNALAKYPTTGGVPVLVAAAPPRANQYEGTCESCRQTVKAGEGQMYRLGDRTAVRHSPACPAVAPRRNQHAGTCSRCRSMVEAGEGLLTKTVAGWDVAHEGQCPAEQDRVAPPPAPRRRNARDGRCERCDQLVGAEQGWLIPPAFTGGAFGVEHEDLCPPLPGGYTGPVWEIGETIGSDRRSALDDYCPYTVGEVLRASVYGELDHPDLQDLPGRAPGRFGRVSGIWTVLVAVAGRAYDTDDGDGAGTGYRWEARPTAKVRPATAEEAADILATEAEQRALHALQQRVRSLFLGPGRDQDSSFLPAGQLTAHLADTDLVAVPLSPVGDAPQLHENELWVTADGRWAMTTVYNGRDGDTWDASNLGNRIAWLHPLTDELTQLVEDLRARYLHADVLARNLHVQPDVARALVALYPAWSPEDLVLASRNLVLASTQDVRDLGARTARQWQDDGWMSYGYTGSGKFTPAQARQLIAAGVRCTEAHQHHQSGRTTPEAIAAHDSDASIAADATRIILACSYGAMVTDDPATARRRLAGHPLPQDKIQTWTEPITVTHVADGWQLWSDGSLSLGRWDAATGTSQVASLAAAAAEGVALLITGRQCTRENREPLLGATEHSTLVHSQHKVGRTGNGASLTLIEHRFTGPGSMTVWWELDETSWYMGEDADVDTSTDVFTTAESAREAFRTAKAALRS